MQIITSYSADHFNARGIHSAVCATLGGIGFLVSNTIHYAFGRAWIYRGTARPIASGFAYFLINAGVGLVITLGLFAAFLAWTPIHYLAGRVLVSVVAGLAMFLLNAMLNFRAL